jgi:hypothetical protein
VWFNTSAVQTFRAAPECSSPLRQVALEQEMMELRAKGALSALTVLQLFFFGDSQMTLGIINSFGRISLICLSSQTSKLK